MMPDECASIRSIARWVLPVFVGPRTALTRGAKPESRPGMGGCLGVAPRNASGSARLCLTVCRPGLLPHGTWFCSGAMRGADLKQLWQYGVSLEDRNQAQSFG